VCGDDGLRRVACRDAPTVGVLLAGPSPLSRGGFRPSELFGTVRVLERL
jgi:hypothetical protein